MPADFETADENGRQYKIIINHAAKDPTWALLHIQCATMRTLNLSNFLIWSETRGTGIFDLFYLTTQSRLCTMSPTDYPPLKLLCIHLRTCVTVPSLEAVIKKMYSKTPCVLSRPNATLMWWALNDFQLFRCARSYHCIKDYSRWYLHSVCMNTYYACLMNIEFFYSRVSIMYIHFQECIF